MSMFTFEESAWEQFAGGLKMGDIISGAQLLTLLESEDEETVEGAFQTMEDLSVTLDISDLPISAASGEAAVRLRLEEQLMQQGKLLTGLEEGDPLRLYLEELAAVPVQGDVRLLAMELAEVNREEMTDAPVQNKLVNLSLSRVVELAGEYTGKGVLLMDLIQEGSLGLWQGILAYESGDFEKIRDWWIRQYMAKAVWLQARASGVGQKMRQAVEDYRAVDERLLTELGRNPTLEEIAEGLHITPEETVIVAKMLESARLIQQAKATQEPEREEEEEQQAVEDTAYFQMRQRIAELLSGLTEQDAKLLTLRFGLEGGLPLSPEETGKILGLTSQEVVAREAAALAKLRQ